MGDRTKSNTSFLEGPVRRPPIARADRKMLPHPTSLGSTTLRLMLNMPSRTWAMTHTSQVFFPQVTMMLSPHSVPRHVPRCRYHPRTPSFLPLQGHFLPPLTCTVRIHCPTARRYLHSVLISAHLPPCPPAFFFYMCISCRLPMATVWSWQCRNCDGVTHHCRSLQMGRTKVGGMHDTNLPKSALRYRAVGSSPVQKIKCHIFVPTSKEGEKTVGFYDQT